MEQIQELNSRYPDTMMNYINFLTRQIQHLKWENQLRSTFTLEKKLGQILSMYWTQTQEGYTVTLPFSLTALAERLQTSRSTLYRVLTQLEEAGVLQRNGKQLIVLQPDALQ